MAAASLDDDSLSLFSELPLSEDYAVRKYECSICLELLFRPKMLQCTGVHTFCEKCLQKHIDGHSSYDFGRLEKYFFCPVCKGRVTVPQNGAAGLQTNYYISEEVDRLRANLERQCDICSATADSQLGRKRKATRVCSDCSLMLCKDCSKNHSHHFPTHSVHRVCRSRPVSGADPPSQSELGGNTLPKVPLAASSPEQPRERCSTHPSEELRFFCRGSEGDPCEQVICRDCRMTDHFHHGHVTDLSKMVQEAQHRLSRHETELQSRVEARATRLQGLRTRQERIRASRNEVRTLLESRARAVIEAVTAHTGQALSQLERQAEEANKRAMEEMEVTRGAQSSLQDMLDTVQQTARAGSEVNKVKVSMEMGRLLEEGDVVGESASDTGLLKGFLLNMSGPVSEVLTEQVLADLLGKTVRL